MSTPDAESQRGSAAEWEPDIGPDVPGGGPGAGPGAEARPGAGAGPGSEAGPGAGSEGGPGSGPGARPVPEPSDAELQAAWEEQLKHVSVLDILVQTAVSLVNLAGRRLGLGPDGDAERDLDEVRSAIDAVRALVPVLEKSDIGPTMKPLRDALSSLQFEYAKLRGAAGGGAATAAEPASPATPPTSPAAPDAASRLWVPGR
jgi:hypothetical protein